MRKSKSGFTTMELVIIMFIVLVLTAMLVPAIMQASKTTDTGTKEHLAKPIHLVKWGDLPNGVSVIEDREHGMLVYVLVNGSHPGGIVVVPLPSEKAEKPGK